MISLRSISFSLALTAASIVHADTKPIELAKTPAAVQATVKTVMGANKLESLEAETEDGTTAYVVEWYDAQEDGHFATIAADGKVTQTEDDVKTTSLPAAALATLKAKRPTGTLPKTSTKMTIDGKVSYSVDVAVGKKTVTLIVDPAGTLIADESVDEEVATLGATTKPAK